MKNNAGIKLLTGILIVAIMITALGGMSSLYFYNKNRTPANEEIEALNNTPDNNTPINDGIYFVESVIDGDTFKVNYKGQHVSVRLIGLNSPEIATSNTSAECFGGEATAYLKNIIEGKYIGLSIDPKQDMNDRYGRLLRYAYLDDGTDIGSHIISDGYGREYTYDGEYYYQARYKQLQSEAMNNKLGLWQDNVCKDITLETAPTQATNNQTASCNIKGNISLNTGEKIYHVPGQMYYEQTQISEEYGERWFCTEEEAKASGWRKSKE